MKKFIYLILILACYIANGQSISVFDVDASNFPMMKAKFYAFDKDGNQLTNLTSSDFELKENGQLRTITNVSCPVPQPLKAISSVLVFDVSGSMSLGPPRIQSAKNAANAWIDGLPLGKSECALVSFDNFGSIVQDFTTLKNKLKAAVNQLTPLGGTNYDQALIDLPAGGLQVAKSGKYKKVIVFLTDGLPNFEPKTNEIIEFAIVNNITINAITLDMQAPLCIKEMTLQTGGQYFENITTLKEAQDTYQKLLQVTQGGDPCQITWESRSNCVAGLVNVELKMKSLDLTTKSVFESPNSKVAKLNFNPAYIKFEKPEPGKIIEKKILVTALNSEFNVSEIKLSNPAYTITPQNFKLYKDDSRELVLSYLPVDSGYTFCKIDFINDICLINFYSSGGWEGISPLMRTIKLIHPNGGEVFVAGSDVNIQWDGVKPSENVTIEYRINENSPWNIITNQAKGFNYKWRVPKVESQDCLARVTSSIESIVQIEMLEIPSGTFEMGNTGSPVFADGKIYGITIPKPFLMSKYEITQNQYRNVMNASPSYWIDDNLPVEQVSWYDAIEFCNLLSDMYGFSNCYTINGTQVSWDMNANGFRLATEIEWEYACKAGSKTDYYNGNLESMECSPTDRNLNEIAWYCANSNYQTKLVGLKKPNNFGLYDMLGNVWEWCWDGNVQNRTVRGASFFNKAMETRSSRRFTQKINGKYNSLGFRIARNQE